MPALVRLSRYPRARLVVACGPCGRRGCWSVARLAERHGAEIPLLELLPLLTPSCKYQRRPEAPAPRPYEPRCLAHFPELGEGPDTPAPGRPLRVIKGGRR